ncbi:MAG: hypothetical protein HQL69_14910 [Magnetococcales bacterium]|nr:hypothetical protein [Magnetococcales bacterium]
MSRFVYVQARLQARYSGHLDDAAWNRLESSTSFAIFLKKIRETALAPWVSAIDENSDIHSLEDNLKAHLFAFIQESSQWVPKGWKSAVLNCQTLFDLHKKPAPNREETLALWLEKWRSMWPDQKGDGQLEELTALVQNHYQHFASLNQSQHGDVARQELKIALQLRFRRFAATPAALFVYILLQALDYERIRGGLCRRRLFFSESRGEKE